MNINGSLPDRRISYHLESNVFLVRIVSDFSPHGFSTLAHWLRYDRR